MFLPARGRSVTALDSKVAPTEDDDVSNVIVSAETETVSVDDPGLSEKSNVALWLTTSSTSVCEADENPARTDGDGIDSRGYVTQDVDAGRNLWPSAEGVPYHGFESGLLHWRSMRRLHHALIH